MHWLSPFIVLQKGGLRGWLSNVSTLWQEMQSVAAFWHLHVRQGICIGSSVYVPQTVECHVVVLTSALFYVQVSQLFDNNGTVLFAMFMAVWGEFCEAEINLFFILQLCTYDYYYQSFADFDS